jgi:hypothetical protein
MGSEDTPLQSLRWGAEGGPRRSAWSEKNWHGNLIVAPAAPPSFTGTNEHRGRPGHDLEPAGFATALDIIVDLSNSEIAIAGSDPAGADVYFAFFVRCFGTAGYGCQFSINPTTGFMATTVPSGGPTPGTCKQSAANPNVFLFQQPRIAGQVWGVLIGAAGTLPMLHNVNVSSICHGVERV